MSIDLRSDTVTRPTSAMRAAMVDAEVGDDVYGEDPTVTELEARVAALLGHEAAIFTPTGSLANQLAMRLLVSPGEEIVCDVQAHVVRAELGAAATFSGITTRTWDAPRGLLDPDVVRQLVRPAGGPYLVSTTAIAVENTHNFGGGTVQPLERLQAVRAIADEHGLGVHLDGARLWNAHVASGVPLHAYGAVADTVSVCLSKGLGAPVGSVLVSSAERIASARVWRKRYGAGMRQVGILAAAGLFALDHNVERLADDHARAQRLAFALAEAVDGVVVPEHVETNIVVLDLSSTPWTAAALAAAARVGGVLVSDLGPTFARLVTHLDVDDDAVAQAAEVLTGLLRTTP
ncbi:MAG TPA: GntG family PLP-dependent aldolase [Candidatus Nanopelagicales bacterium]